MGPSIARCFVHDGCDGDIWIWTLLGVRVRILDVKFLAISSPTRLRFEFADISCWSRGPAARIWGVKFLSWSSEIRENCRQISQRLSPGNFRPCFARVAGLPAELTEFVPKLSEAQWVLFSETVLSKQYSARFLIPKGPRRTKHTAG